MDWTTIIISCIPAAISAVVSYLGARHKGKNDIEKTKQENEATIDKLIKQHEIDIESLREKHRMEMEIKDKEHLQKLQILQKEYELRVAENKTKKDSEIVNNVAADFMQSFMQNPADGIQKFDELMKLKNMFQGGAGEK